MSLTLYLNVILTFIRLSFLWMEEGNSSFVSPTSKLFSFSLRASNKYIAISAMTTCKVRTQARCEKLCEMSTQCRSYTHWSSHCYLFPVQFTEARMDRAFTVNNSLYYHKEGVDSVPRCPPEFHHNETAGICIKHVTAKSTCSDHGPNSSLVVLNTNQKHRTVQSYLEDQDYFFDVFIGGKKNSKGGYSWLNGEEIKGGDWCEDQPEGRECVNLWARHGFCLDDSWCTNIYDFVCEVPLDRTSISRM